MTESLPALGRSYTRGRDAVLRPVEHVHRRIDPDSTPTAGATHLDGRLQLAWAP